MDKKSMTTSEIMVKMVELENHYNALQNKIKKDVDTLRSLNEMYIELDNELKERGHK